MSEIDEFEEEIRQNIRGLGSDLQMRELSRQWLEASVTHKYSYNFSWLGRPVIQYPQDLMALQEIIWRTRPDMIIETGIAHGGSLIFSASMLELTGGAGSVIGIDIEIRPHNRKSIEAHPLFHRISLIEGSSTDLKVVAEVARAAAGKRTMVILDSNHTHKHVFEELLAYAPLVSSGCYLVVFDTVIEDLPDTLYPERLWKQGDNPKTAVHEFLRGTNDFAIDQSMSDKLLITVAPDGFLLCVRKS